ncbi:MAG: hypothetical protein ACSHXW_01055 [Yoonia sp.]
MAISVKELKELTEADLIDRHDKAGQHTQVGVNYYLEELRSREITSYAKKMDRFTRGIFWMTLIVTIATCINVGIFVWERLQ